MRRFSLSKRLSAALLLGLLAALIATVPTLAGVTWCRADPIVKLNGTEVRFDVAVPLEYQLLVNGPIEIKVQTPRGVSRELIFTDGGFNGYGETVTFGDNTARVNADGSFLTTIQVKVPTALGTSVKVPVMVDVYEGIGNLAHVEFGSNNNTTFQILVQGAP